MQNCQNPSLIATYDGRLRPGAFPVAFVANSRHAGDDPYIAVPHVHDTLEIGYCHEGEGIFAIGRKVLAFRSGDTVVVSEVEPHQARNRPGVASVWSWVFVDTVRLLGAHCDDPAFLDTTRLSGVRFRNVLPASEHSEIERLVLALLCEAGGSSAYWQESVRGCIMALLAGFQRLPHRAESGVLGSGLGERIARLQPALRQIQKSYGAKLSVGRLAKRCRMSESNFRQVFRRVMGRSVYQYLMSYRLTMASIELRRGDKTVETIAYDNGFPTLSCFVRKFKARTGQPPRRWARQEKVNGTL